MRAVFRCRKRLRGDVINFFLALFHTTDIVFQRGCLIFAVRFGGGKTQQFGDTLLVGKILDRTFFHHLTERFPERGIFLRLVFSHGFQFAQYFLHGRAANTIDNLVLLQNFARHIQRQVV